MSSHREAPEISKDPVADGTDVYAFVSPNRPDVRDADRQLHPAAGTRRRPELLRVRRRRALRDPHQQPRRRHPRRLVPVQVHARRSATTRPSSTTPARSARSAARTGTGRSSTRSPGSTGRATRCARRSCSARACGVPPVNVGPRSTPDYAKLSAQAVHSVKQGIKVFCGQRADAFHVDLGSIFDLGALRPLNEAHLISMPNMNGVNCGAVLQRPHDRARDPDQAADPRRQRAEEPAEHEGGHRRMGDRQPPQVADVGQGQGQVRRPRSLGAGLPAGQPAVQRGHRADGREGRVERPARRGTTSGTRST